MNGWVKFHREATEKPIFLNSTGAQWKVFTVLLMKANHKANQWDWNGQKFDIQPGQFVTSLDSIKEACGVGVSIRNVRTALVRFENLGFLTSQVTNRGRTITITNWDTYQHDDGETDKPSDKPLTSNRQALDKPLTTIKEVKNVSIKECKKKSIPAAPKLPKKPHPGKAHLAELQELSDHHADLFEREHVTVQLTDHVRRIVKVIEKFGINRCKLVQEGHRATNRDARFTAWQFAYPMLRADGKRRIREPDWGWIEQYRAAGVGQEEEGPGWPEM